MNLRKLIAVGASALALGTGAGILASSADATIGPFGGRYLTAEYAQSFGTAIHFGAHITGNGGQQTVNTRLMRFTGSGWEQVGTTKTETVPSGTDYSNWFYSQSCTPGATYTYTVWSKWASYLWNNADISPGKTITCGS